MAFTLLRERISSCHLEFSKDLFRQNQIEAKRREYWPSNVRRSTFSWKPMPQTLLSLKWGLRFYSLHNRQNRHQRSLQKYFRRHSAEIAIMMSKCLREIPLRAYMDRFNIAYAHIGARGKALRPRRMHFLQRLWPICSMDRVRQTICTHKASWTNCVKT